MNRLRFFLICFLSFIVLAGSAQSNFSEFYRDTDPARDSLNASVKKTLHQEFLQYARADKDTLRQILGHLYLSNDLFLESDFTLAMDHLIQAANFASIQKDTLLLGRINHKKGAIFSTLENEQKAIEYYEMGLTQSAIAKDSTYIAISMEQLGRMFADVREFEKSNEYYRKAIPMVEQFCLPSAMTTTLINYGNSLDEQDSVSKAIQVYNKAIAIGEEIEDDYEIIPAKQNLALVYAKNDSLDKALPLYYECRRVNEQNGWLDFLIYSYDGLAYTYEKMGVTDSAYHYSQKYYTLRDSVIGAQVQNQIIQLEARAKIQKKDIEVLRQKEIALKYQKSLKNTIIIALVLLIISGWIALSLFHRSRKTKLRLTENRKSLQEMASLLATKNAELRDMTHRLKYVSRGSLDKDEDLALKHINYFDLSILTDTDWQSFKALFERSYPNFLQKIRDRFPDITPAEERMFLFVKLRISKSESANILGVQPETIKKTRTRLRKRLSLSKKENLNDFIQSFD